MIRLIFGQLTDKKFDICGNGVEEVGEGYAYYDCMCVYVCMFLYVHLACVKKKQQQQ